MSFLVSTKDKRAQDSSITYQPQKAKLSIHFFFFWRQNFNFFFLIQPSIVSKHLVSAPSELDLNRTEVYYENEEFVGANHQDVFVVRLSDREGMFGQGIPTTYKDLFALQENYSKLHNGGAGKKIFSYKLFKNFNFFFKIIQKVTLFPRSLSPQQFLEAFNRPEQQEKVKQEEEEEEILEETGNVFSSKSQEIKVESNDIPNENEEGDLFSDEENVNESSSSTSKQIRLPISCSVRGVGDYITETGTRDSDFEEIFAKFLCLWYGKKNFFFFFTFFFDFFSKKKKKDILL